MRRLFPFVLWLPELRRRRVLRADVVAGVTVAAILVPQSMAYAGLAGLPAVYGLYASFLPPVVAAFWGSSRHLATGPVAMASLISAATVQSVAPIDSPDYITYSVLLALMVGVIRLTLGLLRLGVLINLLSAPVVAGFTNAAALIIATSQLHHIFGVRVSVEEHHFETVLRVVESVGKDFHWQTLAMAVFTIGLIAVMRCRHEKILVAVILTTLISWLFGFDGAVIGEISGGLPPFQVPTIDFSITVKLFTGALALTLIGLMEALSIAKTLAAKSRQHINLNQELIGQGLSNVVGSFFGSYAVSGSFSRSAVTFSLGGATGFSSAVCSVVVMLTLLFLTPLFYYLPQATLAAVIIVAVSGLFQSAPLRQIWRVSRSDGMIGVTTFAITLGFAPELHYGIITGVCLSLGQYLYQTMRPHVAYLARHGDGHLVDADEHGLALDRRIVVIRFDGRLYFGASSYFEDKVLEALVRLPELNHVIIDAGGINEIDASGEQILRRVVENLRATGVDVYFVRVKDQVEEALTRAGTLDYVGKDHFFEWNQLALDHIYDKMEPTYKARSPLNVPTPSTEEGAWSI